ncbi:MAG: YitT family protein [Pseudomonadota bacterium]
MTVDETKVRHTAMDDAQGIATGVLLSGLGVHILTSAGLITGQTAGLAVIISYLSGWSFGIVFFLVNLPFYALAYKRLGTEFTVKSILGVTALSIVTELLPYGLPLSDPHPGAAAVAFGACVGIGLLALFRHNGSLGGLGVVALMVQDQTGFKAGYVQLIVDGLLFTVAAALFPLSIVAWSLLGAIVVNVIIAFNHRRDRYIAT